MSDFFRIQIPPELVNASLSTLANISHQAEDTDDDVLLMQCAAVVQSRSETEQSMFREIYIHQWTKHMEARKKPAKQST